MESNLCNLRLTIPQFGSTCWFNAILMASLWSQGSRKIILKETKNWKKDNIFSKIIKKFLKIYKMSDNAKALKLLHNIKPEELLLLTINETNDNLFKEIFKKKIQNDGYEELGWHNEYITLFYKGLNVRVLDIICYRENEKFKYLYNFFKYFSLLHIEGGKKYQDILTKYQFNLKQETENIGIKTILNSPENPPDILILYNEDLTSKFVNIMKHFFNAYNKNNKNAEKIHSSTNFSNYTFKGIDTYENEIEFGDYVYKLDSCLISNYNDVDDVKHSIVGLTCENEKYVYNGWTINNGSNELTSSCPLMKYDWNLKRNSDFCLKDCNIDLQIDNKSRCYSFNKGNRILVYVKHHLKRTIIDVKEKTQSISSITSNDIKTDRLYNKDLKSIIYDIHGINELSTDELKNQILIFNPLLEDYLDEISNDDKLKTLLYHNIISYLKIYDYEIDDVKSQDDEYVEKQEEFKIILEQVNKYLMKKIDEIKSKSQNIEKIKTEISNSYKDKSLIKQEKYLKIFNDILEILEMENEIPKKRDRNSSSSHNSREKKR